MKEAEAGAIWLNPLTVQDELGNGALPGLCDDFIGCTGDGINVDFGVGNCVVGEETLGLAAIATPGGGVDEQFHTSILREGAMSYGRQAAVAPKGTNREWDVIPEENSTSSGI